jgi:hypothetical protein
MFNYIKDKFQWTEFMEQKQLLAEIREILNGMSGIVLKAVFIEWEKRLPTRIDAEGEHRE